jgi:hypothetical protein
MMNDRCGGFVVYQDKGAPTFSEHCKPLKKLSMLMSAIVSKRTINSDKFTPKLRPFCGGSYPFKLSLNVRNWLRNGRKN